MIVLDAIVLIGFLDADDARHDRAEALMAREVDDDVAVNVLTLPDTLVAPTRTGQSHRVRGVLADLAVQVLPLPAESATTLAVLRAETSLRMPGRCVLLSALDQQARLATFDDRRVTAGRSRGVTVLIG